MSEALELDILVTTEPKPVFEPTERTRPTNSQPSPPDLAQKCAVGKATADAAKPAGRTELLSGALQLQEARGR